MLTFLLFKSYGIGRECKARTYIAKTSFSKIQSPTEHVVYTARPNHGLVEFASYIYDKFGAVFAFIIKLRYTEHT